MSIQLNPSAKPMANQAKLIASAHRGHMQPHLVGSRHYQSIPASMPLVVCSSVVVGSHAPRSNPQSQLPAPGACKPCVSMKVMLNGPGTHQFIKDMLNGPGTHQIIKDMISGMGTPSLAQQAMVDQRSTTHNKQGHLAIAVHVNHSFMGSTAHAIISFLDTVDRMMVTSHMSANCFMVFISMGTFPYHNLVTMEPTQHHQMACMGHVWCSGSI
jgi:hypothetical protein